MPYKDKEKLKKHNKEYYHKNIIKEKLRNKLYRYENKEKIKEQIQKWKKEHPNYDKQYYEKNKIKRKENRKLWSLKNSEKEKENAKNWKKEHPQYDKEYYKKNKNKIRATFRKRTKTDPMFRLKNNLRCRMGQVFKNILNIKKECHTFEIIGCGQEKLKIYIENKFSDRMTWENYGSWHIDHIIPVSSARTKEEMIKLCHYTNLQPLWAVDNLKKGSKIIS